MPANTVYAWKLPRRHACKHTYKGTSQQSTLILCSVLFKMVQRWIRLVMWLRSYSHIKMKGGDANAVLLQSWFGVSLHQWIGRTGVYAEQAELALKGLSITNQSWHPPGAARDCRQAAARCRTHRAAWCSPGCWTDDRHCPLDGGSVLPHAPCIVHTN